MIDTTCKNCKYDNACIMYDPTMRRCEVYKERRAGDVQKQVQDILGEKKTASKMVRKM